MSAIITLTLDDEQHTPFPAGADRLVRYEQQGNGSIVTYLAETGLITCVVRQSKSEIDALIRSAVQPV
jgi:hypothetical protein